jgi:uncharacterized membrane protein YeaQ/YmgE (transglycosylase-associated protein family)
MLIGIIGWLLVGLIAGFVGSKLVNLHGDEPAISIAAAAGAAVVGGWLFCAISGSPVSPFNIWSLLIAAWVAVIAVVLWHAVRRRYNGSRKLRRIWS